MALTQILWSLGEGKTLEPAALSSEDELEEILYKNIELLDPDWLVIGRQVRTKNGKRLDLLCMDQNENLVVVELKKSLTPREVTAQVIEYASYMAEKLSDDLAAIYLDYSERYLGERQSLDEAFHAKFGASFQNELIDQRDSEYDQKIKMVIVAADMDMSTEHIIQFLRDTYHVNINILFFQVFQHGTDRLLSRAWFNEDFELEETPRQNDEWNGEFYVSFGNGGRKWEDAAKYGFISGGGGKWYSQTLGKLHVGDRVWVNIPQTGYVGVGYVTGEMVQADFAKFFLNGEEKNMCDLNLAGNYFYTTDPDQAEYIVPVEWIKTVPQSQAVRESGFFGNQNTVSAPKCSKWQFTVERLKNIWNLS